jgi:hypothetical protein
MNVYATLAKQIRKEKVYAKMVNIESVKVGQRLLQQVL